MLAAGTEMCSAMRSIYTCLCAQLELTVVSLQKSPVVSGIQFLLVIVVSIVKIYFR